MGDILLYNIIKMHYVSYIFIVFWEDSCKSNFWQVQMLEEIPALNYSSKGYVMPNSHKSI